MIKIASPPRILPYKPIIQGHLSYLEDNLVEHGTALLSEVYYRLGMFYMNFSKKRNSKIAKEMLIRGARGLHPLCIYMLGWIQETEGNLELAEDFYLKAIDVDPVDPIIFHKLSLMIESTLQYVNQLKNSTHSKVERKKNKSPSHKVFKQKAHDNIYLRVLLHERLSAKLALLDGLRSTEIQGPCKVYIDPLWISKFLFVFSFGENWAYFLGHKSISG